MPRHHEIRILPYTQQQMFDLVAGIEAYPEFLPWCKSVHITSKTETHVTADLAIGYKLFHERFVSRVALEAPRRIAVEYQKGPMSHLSNQWLFRPAKGRGKKMWTEVEFEVSFDFKSPLLSAVMDVFFDKALARMVAAFEERAHQLYGKNSP